MPHDVTGILSGNRPRRTLTDVGCAVRSYDKNETVMPLIPLLPSCGRVRQSSSQIWGFRFSLFLFSIHVDDKRSAW